MKEKKLRHIGVLIFDGFLANEMTAPFDVFTKKDSSGSQLFEVSLIAKQIDWVSSEEGIRVLPDYSISNCPPLDVLIVPSSFQPEAQIKDQELIRFIREQNEQTEYTASHCAGAFLLGESGVAYGSRLVTYCGGSESLQKAYPKVLVQNDTLYSVVEDGKFISSNGNLVSYLASLDLLEKMAGKFQRQQVEEELLIHKLIEHEYSELHHEK